MEPTENHPSVPKIWTHSAGDNITLVIWNERWTINLEKNVKICKYETFKYQI